MNIFDAGRLKVSRQTVGTGNDALFLLFEGEWEREECEGDRIASLFSQEEKELNFTILSVFVSDWDSDLSPWAAPSQTEGRDFEGKGPEFLQKIREDLLPYIREHFPESTPVFSAGYSLAGLFSLWAFYEADLFSGAVSCSGSLWLTGWDEYAKNAHAKEKSLVYLSLGGKEERSSNKMIARVGDSTRAQEALLKKDRNVVRTTLVMNSGGHFADSAKRLKLGFEWILSNL